MLNFGSTRTPTFTYKNRRIKRSLAKVASAWLTVIGVKYFGWSVSLMMHLIVLLAGLMVYSILKGSTPPPASLIVPDSFFNGTTPSFNHDNGKSLLNAMSEKYPLPSQQWSNQLDQTALNRMLNDPAGLNHNAIIGLGAPSGNSAQATGGGGLGPLGMPGGSIAAGPGVSFLGVHSRANSAVIILDTSGSMIDGWDYVESQVKLTLVAMRPYQKFAVIIFSDRDQILGPDHLVRASMATRQDIDNQLDNVAPQGHNDDMLEPFLTPFQAAFAMHPDCVYFLTDGNFDSRLVQSVADLYAGQNIPVYTFAFLDDPGDAASDADSIIKLKKIAAETNGEFHVISQNVLQQSQ
ncbi:MAG TPA: vWA domain-containing protein [Phycisphaerae bacterium]|nr:vWA domain-containing protein [Phycisphaerae bacterium]